MVSPRTPVFFSPIKLTSTYKWNNVESGIKHPIIYMVIIWKESLNGDGQQFHQYLQNETSRLK
jgi:hypothetical protein